HEKSPKCLGWKFRGFWGILQRSLDMSALGFRAGVCRKNVEQLEVIRLREKQQECSAISADPTLQVEIRALHLTLHDEFINEAVTQEALEAALAGKQIDASQTEFCKAYDKQLEEMTRNYLQP
ncbi:hypothetical protein, partial [Eikenella corrodens]|uniref:hypothetical protein n=2 Tax=Eikenella corrodens TaxID=539 RepID=UPI001955C9B8